MGLGIIRLLANHLFQELDRGLRLLPLEPDESQMVLRLRIFRVGF